MFDVDSMRNFLDDILKAIYTTLLQNFNHYEVNSSCVLSGNKYICACDEGWEMTNDKFCVDRNECKGNFSS